MSHEQVAHQLKACLVQDSEPSEEQAAHVRSKKISPTRVLGLPFFRQSEEQREKIIKSKF